MTEPVRSQLLAVLAEVGAIHPDMRFGQLVCNMASLVEMTPEAVWTVEDGPMLAEAVAHRDGLLEQRDLTAAPDLDWPERRDLLASLRAHGDHHPGIPFGALVADLVARFARPGSPIDWSGAIWDIEDEDLLRTVREQLARPAPAGGMITVPSGPVLTTENPTPTKP